MLNFFTKSAPRSIPITPIATASFKEWLKQQSAVTRNWLLANNFTAKSGEYCLLPNAKGEITEIFLGIENSSDFWAFGAPPIPLKKGTFRINAPQWSALELQRAVIAWGCGCYQFTRHKKANTTGTSTAKLVLPKNCDYQHIANVLGNIFLVRDLINQPAENLGPAELAKVAVDLAKQHGAKVTQVIGENLLKKNYPLLHAVGRASHRAPRFVEFKWDGTKAAKKNHKFKPLSLALVGKGICFDSGGLDLKPSSSMEKMKKDMAGAAHALGLAQMIMTARLPLKLHVLLPLAENLLSANSYKPGDVLPSRQGKTIEIGNTDAEGRLILADALTRAAEEKPDLIIDFSTLTGAAEVALGLEVTAMFTDNDILADDIVKTCAEEKEYAWRLPLHKNYRHQLDSKIADISNCSSSGRGGAITAALFLREFMPEKTNWLHFDFSGYNAESRPGRPTGGEAFGLRGLFEYIKKHLCTY